MTIQTSQQHNVYNLHLTAAEVLPSQVGRSILVLLLINTFSSTTFHLKPFLDILHQLQWRSCDGIDNNDDLKNKTNQTCYFLSNCSTRTGENFTKSKYIPEIHIIEIPKGRGGGPSLTQHRNRGSADPDTHHSRGDHCEHAAQTVIIRIRSLHSLHW